MDLEKGEDWTKQYSRWLEGAAAELTTVLVPGFMFPKKEIPKWQLPLKVLLALSAVLVALPLIFFDPPLSQVFAVSAGAAASLILCSGWHRLAKFSILSGACLVTVHLGLK